MERTLKKGDRVRVAANHRWLPDRYGTIKQVDNRKGNCFLVKFDRDELGMWHDEDGDPVGTETRGDGSGRCRRC